jgi:hypothetical protein
MSIWDGLVRLQGADFLRSSSLWGATWLRDKEKHMQAVNFRQQPLIDKLSEWIELILLRAFRRIYIWPDLKLQYPGWHSRQTT